MLFTRNHTEPHMQGFTCNHFRDRFNYINKEIKCQYVDNYKNLALLFDFIC